MDNEQTQQNVATIAHKYIANLPVRYLFHYAALLSPEIIN